MTEIDPDNIPAVASMISACEGFISLNEKGNAIQLVQPSLLEYLRHLNCFFDAVGKIGKVCAAYLSLVAFNDGSCQSDEDFEARA
nr:uncharacterized protein CTRU02_05625 [Colletotrichum truncatum]KAF6794068.1 hypothetical protein CTRU02_05625 [Colletotrichum truncatum]